MNVFKPTYALLTLESLLLDEKLPKDVMWSFFTISIKPTNKATTLTGKKLQIMSYGGYD